MPDFKKDPNEIGCLWIKTGQRGEYMTGQINGQPVVVFRNDRKQGKQPDWRVLKSKPRDEAAPQRAPVTTPADPDDEIW